MIICDIMLHVISTRYVSKHWFYPLKLEGMMHFQPSLCRFLSWKRIVSPASLRP